MASLGYFLKANHSDVIMLLKGKVTFSFQIDTGQGDMMTQNYTQFWKCVSFESISSKGYLATIFFLRHAKLVFCWLCMRCIKGLLAHFLCARIVYALCGLMVTSNNWKRFNLHTTATHWEEDCRNSTKMVPILAAEGLRWTVKFAKVRWEACIYSRVLSIM